MPPPPSSLASGITLSVVGLWCKAFLALTTRGYKVHGTEHLLKALENKPEMIAAAAAATREGKGKDVSVPGHLGSLPRRGIITVCNHNSVVDDPMMWSMLPLSTFMPFARPSHTCHNLRWTLGASDIMFTNPVMSKFFGWGQVIETVRGGGIYQPAVDTAIKRLEQGGHVHIFPEGKVNQEKPNPKGGLHRFKWGVGRILMDAQTMPEVIPIWISGFDQIMNERRTWPRGMLRTGANVSITVGAPITARVQPLVEAYHASKASGTDNHGPTATRIHIVHELQEAVRQLGDSVEEREGRFERREWSQSRANAHKTGVLESSA